MTDLAPVMVAVDLGPGLEDLVRCAQGQARCADAPLVVVHVVERAALAKAVNVFDYGELLLDELAEAELADEERARRLLLHRLAPLGVPESALEVHGGPVARLVSERAERLKARLLVLGSPKSRFGSVAVHAARHAPCDVYIHRGG